MAQGLKRRSSLLLCMVLLLVICAWSAASLGAMAEDPALITDFNALVSAVIEAKDGDVLLVGDVDFAPHSSTVANSCMFIEINKSITLRSGQTDGAAVFSNGGLVLTGSKIAGEGISVHFEDIVFDGLADGAHLTADDFAYPWSESLGEYLMYVPMKAQQALSFRGNVEASFAGCVFKNYMHEYGPVIDIRYDDYTGNPALSGAFADYSACKPDIAITDCRIENNSARYDDGAFYIEANSNAVFFGRLSAVHAPVYL